MTRAIATATLLALTLSALSGCAFAAQGPRAAEEAFFAALEEGDGSAALAMTTYDGEIGCEELITRYDKINFGVATSEIGDVTVNGDTATVEFSYAMVGGLERVDVQGHHDLVLVDGTWLIVWPDEYVIKASIPDRIAAELSVEGRPGEDPGCVTSNAGGTFESIALPGSYEINLVDPQGIFRDDLFGDLVIVSDDAPAEVELTFSDETSKDSVASYVEIALRDAILTCAASNFIDSTCPDGLPEARDGLTLSRYPKDRYTDTIEVTDIFSDDGRNWSFTAGGAEFLFFIDGVAMSLPIEFSGQIVLDGDGQIAVVLN